MWKGVSVRLGGGLTIERFSETLYPVFLILVYSSLLAAEPRALPLVQPSPDHRKLEALEAGLSALEQIDDQVAPVVVIGAYRSGKSFLLNQILGVGCDMGFGVGHTRETHTKGAWVWSEGVVKEATTANSSSVTRLVFIDTEGLESVKRTDTYDDRIFAFSAALSSLLIYNLAETIRESDVAKLSFATQLGKELIGREDGVEGGLQP
eukprot:CAMPEP_0177579746 /NCGR_PEP_ID=MMETSP0419_2-20121207/1139_1 /TAXON_ID=582737 /ORGANISM="Tetraselmis sp., Strain GSL018" /LENGTH=206 /DNA_ID=CAMNT_0019068463 /DNA_START=415 /DNA_END=1032 /DNA_ORIENTATION=-